MARPVPNVQITTDSFYGLINKTNILLNGMTVEFVTTANSTTGANTNGNCSVVGILAANTLATTLLRGGTSGNTANIATLTIGLSNSSTSSNVVITGYTSNIVANSINLLSNTLIQASNVLVNTAVTRINSNTVLSGNSTTNNFVVIGNSTATSVTITSNTVNVTSDSLSVNTVSTITGNTTIKSNSTNTNLIVLANGVTSNVTLFGNIVTVSSNLSVSGNLVSISGNVVVDTNTLFVDSVNNRVGIGTDTPDHEFELVATGDDPYFALVNDTHNTTLHLTSSNNASTNTINFFATTNNNLKFSTNNNVGTGYVFISSNGNIGLANSTPNALITIGAGTKVYSNGTVQTSGDLICTGDLYANIVFMGGTSQATVTATVCPIVPPNTSYSSANVEASTIQGPNPYNSFTNTTPQRIDVIKGTEYQAVKYTLQVQDVDQANEVFMTEVSVVYGFGNAHSTTYGTIFTNTAFIDVTVDANSTFFTLMAAPTAAYLASRGGTANLQFRGVRQKCR